MQFSVLVIRKRSSILVSRFQDSKVTEFTIIGSARRKSRLYKQMLMQDESLDEDV